MIKGECDESPPGEDSADADETVGRTNDRERARTCALGAVLSPTEERDRCRNMESSVVVAGKKRATRALLRAAGAQVKGAHAK